MFYDTARRDHGMTQDPLTALVVPRPIGWISTLDGQGRVNLAPYSFYNAVSASPPMVYFSTTGTYGDNPTKHSRRNAEETGEFVAGLAPAPSRYVKPPRVAKSPIALECKYWKTIEMPVEEGREGHRATVVFGHVVGIHIDDGIIKDGRIDTLAFKPVARLGYSEYTTTDNVWKMRRPDDPRYQ